MLVRFTIDNITTSTTNSDNNKSTIINNSNNQKQQQNQKKKRGEKSDNNNSNKKNYDKIRKPGRRPSSSTIRSEGIKLKMFEESTLPPIN
jgi:hypothetical protein